MTEHETFLEAAAAARDATVQCGGGCSHRFYTYALIDGKAPIHYAVPPWGGEYRPPALCPGSNNPPLDKDA